MNTKQMNEFLETRTIFDEMRYIAIDSNGDIYGYSEKPTYKIYEWDNYAESQFSHLGYVDKPTHPELELYTYG